jgi:hypothetical protein
MVPEHRLSTADAARRAGVHPSTINRWCAFVPGLGRRVMGRWYVNPVVLDRLLAGERPDQDQDRGAA